MVCLGGFVLDFLVDGLGCFWWWSGVSGDCGGFLFSCFVLFFFEIRFGNVLVFVIVW